VIKMYFVGIKNPEPDYEVDMASLFVFDSASRLLSRVVPVRVGDDIREPILRIRWAVWVARRGARGRAALATGRPEGRARGSPGRAEDGRRRCG
jgi:hypothetical protein